MPGDGKYYRLYDAAVNGNLLTLVMNGRVEQLTSVRVRPGSLGARLGLHCDFKLRLKLELNKYQKEQVHTIQVYIKELGISFSKELFVIISNLRNICNL